MPDGVVIKSKMRSNNIMNNINPIGVFDSGLGGLTAVKEISKIMPHENIIYFGDTGRVPYGNKSREAVQKYAFQPFRNHSSY